MEDKHDVLVVGAGLAGMRARDRGVTTWAPTSPWSRSCTPPAATPARRKAASTRRSATPPRTARSSTGTTRSRAPTTSATRTRSRSSARRGRATSSSSSAGAPVFSRTPDGRIAQRPFGAAGAPRTAYAADITGHVLIQVLYEQLVKREIKVYEEYFAWKLVEDGGRCAGVVCWDLLHGGVKAISGEDGRSSRPEAQAASTSARPTRTPVRATGWGWPCAPERRSRTWR